MGCNVIKWNCGALLSAERNHHERSQIPRDVARKAAVTHGTMPQIENCKRVFEEEKYQTIDWPGNSPDLNPIENVCSLLKNKVADRQLTSAQEMETAIKLVWIHEITPEYCRNLVESMPRRLQAVLNNRGGHTKY